MEKNIEKTDRNPITKIIIGLYLLIGGGVLFLVKTGQIGSNIKELYFSGFTILALLGLIIMANSKNKFIGLIAFLIGLIGFSSKYFGVNITFSDVFFPLLLLSIGLVLIFKPTCKKRTKKKIISDDAEEINIFSASKKVFTTDSFKSGSIISIFGGSEHDLRNVELRDSKTIDIVAIFGGCKLYIPSDWDVKIEISPIFGSFTDKRRKLPSDSNSNKKLIIKGIVIFGGGEITN